MGKFRVKIIADLIKDIQQNTDEVLSVYSDISIFRTESVCDYNILIVDLRAVSGSQVMNLNYDDFRDFLNKPSVILCIADGERMYESYSAPGTKWVPRISNYDWLPRKDEFKVINKKGESLKPTVDSGRFNKLFCDYDWQWQCIFSPIREDTPSYVSMADNITGQNVALRIEIREGIIIIIPTPQIPASDTNRYSTFLRTLINLTKEEVEVLTEREKQEPDWIEKYVVPEELEIRDKIKKLQKQYQTLKEAHKLFYEVGKTLTKTVNFVLSEIGFNTQMKEDEGAHDIEICEGDLTLVIEITSSEGNWININKTRQLLHWCRAFEQQENKKPKGILIANPYCELPVEDRDEPFTIKAIQQGEAEEFCLMTTVELYNIFCKFWKGGIDKQEIKELFVDTKGLLKFEE